MKQERLPGNQSVVVLRPNKRKVIGYLLGSLAFVSGGIVTGAAAGVIGWLSMLFFGLCAVVFLVQLLPGASYLRVTPEGFLFAVP